MRNVRTFDRLVPFACTFLGLCLLPSLCGCRKPVQNNDHSVKRPGEPDVISVGENDKEMNEAIDVARSTVDDFIKHLKEPVKGESLFAVKKKYEDRGKVEHMWLNFVTFDGTAFRGKVGNEPLDVYNVQLGDPATVAPKDISDWMFVRDGKLVGGYSIRLLYNRASPEEKKKMDAEAGFKVE